MELAKIPALQEWWTGARSVAPSPPRKNAQHCYGAWRKKIAGGSANQTDAQSQIIKKLINKEVIIIIIITL